MLDGWMWVRFLQRRHPNHITNQWSVNTEEMLTKILKILNDKAIIHHKLNRYAHIFNYKVTDFQSHLFGWLSNIWLVFFKRVYYIKQKEIGWSIYMIPYLTIVSVFNSLCLYIWRRWRNCLALHQNYIKHFSMTGYLLIEDRLMNTIIVSHPICSLSKLIMLMRNKRFGRY